MKKLHSKRIICFFLLGSLMLEIFTVKTLPVQAAFPSQYIRLTEVKSLALANSASYRKIKNKITNLEMSYQSAVKSIQLKKKKMSTFKWTPLLSFKFPEKPTLADEFEFTYKPIQIQYQITTEKHKLSDEVYSIYEKVSNLFVDIYTLQETIAFDEKSLAASRNTLEKNKNRLLIGQASQADIDKMESAIQKLTSRISTNGLTMQSKKEELSQLIDMNITDEYTFRNPYVKATLSRAENLQAMIDATLNNSQELYELKMATQQASIAMETNYSLMKNQYGGKMWHIDNYVNQAKNGEKIDTDAMKTAYQNLLQDVDQPWNGNIKFLFIKIPKEWLKGEIAGSRYVEEDPYALSTSILDYQEALSDENAKIKELTQKVKTTFNSLILSANTYDGLKKSVEKSRKAAEEGLIKNSLGELAYEELKDAQDAYEEDQMTAQDALASYTKDLFSFDRLTCGAVSAFLQGTGTDLNPAIGGDSYLVEDTADGATYYIRSIIEDNAFEVGVYIPDDFSVDVTDYELWIDNTRLINKTSVKKPARHLTFTKNEYTNVFFRFYADGKIVDDCEIDPTQLNGPLNILEGYRVESKSVLTLGTYQSSMDADTGLTKISINPEDGLGIVYYAIETSTGGKLYNTKEYSSIKEEFSYLSVISNDLDKLVLTLYDSNEQLLYRAYFDTENLEIRVLPE